MKKETLLLIALLAVSINFVMAQKPRPRIIKDTTKTITTKTVYEPDTIAVYFKELVIYNKGVLSRHGLPDSILNEGIPEEIWRAGFVIWQTYVAVPNYNDTLYMGSGNVVFSNTGTLSNVSQPKYYTNPYKESDILNDKFLYIDKTPVKNKVILSFKR